MTEKREGQFNVTHPPEPWKVFEVGDGTCEIDHAGDGSIDGFHSKETAHRIVAAVNFCRTLRTEFMEQHTLTNIENIPFVAGMFLLEKDGGAE